jgi:hypothetical protein
VEPVVVVYPLSGYVNRLQAMASSALIAKDLDRRLVVCWEPDTAAPAAPDVLFAPEWLDATFAGGDEIRDTWHIDRASIEPYLRQGPDAIVLAGRDRGEQAFMPELRAALSDTPDVPAIVFEAGGKFALGGDATLSAEQAAAFRQVRGDFYRSLPMSSAIEERVAQAVADRGPFIGLHLRYRDRSGQAPLRRAIAPALQRVAERTGLSSVFVASDTPAERDAWLVTCEELGLHAWTVDPGEFPRDDPRSALGALVDWRVLGHSSGMVFFAESSFAEEAAVASGHWDDSIGLSASTAQGVLVKAREYATAAVTYPRRHGWLGKP